LSEDEANKKVESFITDCFDQKVSKVIIVTGKGLHSQNDKDPYISKKFGILKNSVPDFIKNNSSLMKKIKKMQIELWKLQHLKCEVNFPLIQIAFCIL